MISSDLNLLVVVFLPWLLVQIVFTFGFYLLWKAQPSYFTLVALIGAVIVLCGAIFSSFSFLYPSEGTQDLRFYLRGINLFGSCLEAFGLLIFALTFSRRRRLEEELRIADE